MIVFPGDIIGFVVVALYLPVFSLVDAIGKYEDLELRTPKLFTECLISLGAISKDMDLFTLSREDLEELVGE